MAYDLQWLIPGQVMFYRFWDETTEDELRESLYKGLELSSTSDYPLIHSLADVSEVTKVLPLMRSLQVVKEVTDGARVNSGWNIVVGQKDPILKFATNLARQLFHQRQASFDTMPEALDHLKQMDDLLQWEMADQTLLPDIRQTDPR